jgi:hypothetical protein
LAVPELARIDPVVMEWIYDSVPNSRERLQDETLRGRIAALTYSSRALGRILMRETEALDIVSHLDIRPERPDNVDEIARWSRL